MSVSNANSGVDYKGLDPFKKSAQDAARETSDNLGRFRGAYKVHEPSRGESAFLIETPVSYLAHVEEGLGTKNLVADAMRALTDKSYYQQIAQCTVAMIVNDLITLGALPLSVAMHLAVENDSWFNDQQRSVDLIKGWRNACDLARCAWGGGETPALRGIVVPGASLLSGSAIGIIEPKSRLITGNIDHGDVIIMIESSGIHANGLSMARKIASHLPEGYLTKLPGGRTFGETLLDPTHIYVRFVEECLDEGLDIHYAVNMTGHGWRKLMRLDKAFAYTIHTLPTQLPIFGFLQEHGPVTDEEAYGSFNMSAGFALYLKESEADKVIKIARTNGFRAFVAGYIEAGEKKVVIKPKGLVYEGKTLEIR